MALKILTLIQYVNIDINIKIDTLTCLKTGQLQMHTYFIYIIVFGGVLSILLNTLFR